MTTLLPAAMLAEEVEQILETHLVRTPFMTSCGSATTSLAAPDRSSGLQSTDPTGTTHKVM